MEVNHRGHEAAVSQQFADRQQIDSGFEHARRKTVTQSVRRDVGKIDASCQSCHFASFLNGGAGQRYVLRLPEKEIAGGPHLFPEQPQFS